MSLKLRDVMSTRIEVVHPEATIQKAAEKMKDYDIGILPVVEDQEAIGMITDRDITIRATAKGLDPKQTPVWEVMTSKVIACPADYDVKEASKIMEENQIRRLLIVDEAGFPVGIFSLGDLARRESDEKLKAEVLKEVSKPE